MKSLHEFLGELIGLLEAAGVPYMVTGSIASTLYGRPRATQDVDLVIDPNTESLDRFVRSAAARDYCVDDQDAREALVRRRAALQSGGVGRRRPTTVSGLNAYVVSPEVGA